MKKILLAIASDSLRDAIHFELSQKNYQLMVAGNGQDAFDLINENQVDLMVSCLNLPVIDGPGLSVLLREQTQNRFTPVLLLINGSIILSESELLSKNISSTLNIPFEMDELLFKIEKLLPF